MKRPCRACGCEIEMIEGPKGKAIPVQKVRTIYALDPADEVVAGQLYKIDLEPATDHYVSHFETCSDPSRFSRRNQSGNG